MVVHTLRILDKNIFSHFLTIVIPNIFKVTFYLVIRRCFKLCGPVDINMTDTVLVCRTENWQIVVAHIVWQPWCCANRHLTVPLHFNLPPNIDVWLAVENKRENQEKRKVDYLEHEPMSIKATIGLPRFITTAPAAGHR